MIQREVDEMWKYMKLMKEWLGRRYFPSITLCKELGNMEVTGEMMTSYSEEEIYLNQIYVFMFLMFNILHLFKVY